MPEILARVPEHWADPIFTRAQAETLLAQPHHLLLALNAGQGGHLLARLVPQAPADLLTLYVPESCRNQGHARQLMQALLAHARAAACPALTLEVRSDNTAAIKLYSVLGMSQVAKRAGYYPPSVSSPSGEALVFSLQLA